MTTQINYYEYLQSPQWETKTEPIRLRNRSACECCNLRWGCAVHHRTYERLGNELDEDLLHICDLCHKVIHGFIPIGRIFLWPSRLPFLLELRKEQECLNKSLTLDSNELTLEQNWNLMEQDIE